MGRNSAAGDVARRARVPRMKIPCVNRLYIGPRLTVGFVVIILLMLGADGFLLWQFHIARVQADRLAGVSQELISRWRLQTALLSFDDERETLTLYQDRHPLWMAAGP